ncbi:hypothetical protein HHI36_013864 [Cryptolaemus montrouzieri]|uniref:Uncharacterized protein n=1 Tax=Cryptolaemus montrouzieri TaxID=559131 RepID=A0ABD2N1G7_9CUCU
MYLNYRELDANIIILGAGITGLSAAYNLLKKDPHSDFLVLDTDEKMDFSVRADNSSLWNMRWLKTPTKHARFFDNKKYKKHIQFVCLKQKNTLKLLDELNIPLLKQNEENRGKILVDYDSVHEISGKEEILDFLSTEERINLTTLCKKLSDRQVMQKSFIYESQKV